MRSVSHPFVFDAFYTTATGTLIPISRHHLHNVHVLGGGGSTFRGYDAATARLSASTTWYG